jgi:hypothetical protein
MSFSFEFIATRQDAHAILVEEHMPESVREFLFHGLLACKSEDLVHVKAFGHLFNNDYPISTATLSVTPVSFRKPKNGEQS